ncbi:MAG: hypothetical protein IJ735_02645 [Clostridia bacterium]|nr:hypothetical protein [Clostridia bacterium]
MDPILIAVVVVLCQYPLAILTLIKMFRCDLDRAAMLVWNFAIILLPFIGAGAFWIYYLSGKKRIEKNASDKRTTRSIQARKQEEENVREPTEEGPETETKGTESDDSKE